MEISNDDLARILGRMEAKLDAQGQSSLRQEAALASLDSRLTSRIDGHEIRLRTLENGAAKAGVIAGISSSVGIAVIIEIVKRTLNQ